nr:uncharacterized protein LOC114079197 [Marmota flaviventris]
MAPLTQAPPAPDVRGLCSPDSIPDSTSRASATRESPLLPLQATPSCRLFLFQNTSWTLGRQTPDLRPGLSTPCFSEKRENQEFGERIRGSNEKWTQETEHGERGPEELPGAGREPLLQAPDLTGIRASRGNEPARLLPAQCSCPARGRRPSTPEVPEEVEQTQHSSVQDPAAETPQLLHHGTNLHQAPGTRQPDDQGQLLHSASRVQRTSGSSDLMPIQLRDPATASDSISPMSIASQCPTLGTSCLVLDWGWLSNSGLRCVCLWVHLRPWLSLSSY